jgi:hypothetical protein
VTKLIEICFVCGFVHRDDRAGVRQHKLHYHFQAPLSSRLHKGKEANWYWGPNGQMLVGENPKYTVLQTVCLGCLPPDKTLPSGRVEPNFRLRNTLAGWLEARKCDTAKEHKTLTARYNATLLDAPIEWSLEARNTIEYAIAVGIL